ncbi:hypothetical protein ACHAPU_005353 [Fusarium lateritium]
MVALTEIWNSSPSPIRMASVKRPDLLLASIDKKLDEHSNIIFQRILEDHVEYKKYMDLVEYYRLSWSSLSSLGLT